MLAGQGDKSAVDMAKIVQERDQLKALDKQRRKSLHDQRAAFEVACLSASCPRPPNLLPPGLEHEVESLSVTSDVLRRCN